MKRDIVFNCTRLATSFLYKASVLGDEGHKPNRWQYNNKVVLDTDSVAGVVTSLNNRLFNIENALWQHNSFKHVCCFCAVRPLSWYVRC